MEYLDVIKECIYGIPLPLSKVTDPLVISYINSLLPYKVGIEVECPYKDAESKSVKIEDVITSHDSHEKRFQLVPGIKGLIGLWNVTLYLKKYCELNPLSGIHYHVDLGKEYGAEELRIINDLELGVKWLKELESWNYKGNYNSRGISCGGHTWMRFNSLGTIEFRIGEMTFDYSTMVSRILHASSIAGELRSAIGESTVSLSKRLEILQNKIKSSNSAPEITTEDMFKVVNQRVIRI
jgi:hypothetical protein